MKKENFSKTHEIINLLVSLKAIDNILVVGENQTFKISTISEEYPSNDIQVDSKIIFPVLRNLKKEIEDKLEQL